ncbi:MAG: YgdI/YgdR family lipoprotein [Mixta calida]|uniref:YgdI/YgdR family lipoprotein n=1 Tax=Mixta calida TaxID=665913 RepID=A0ABM6S501_9GAMM|nr:MULTISPECIES: YgdI/YgdR family lipoprotein [Mixta]AIX72679.1 lipoprotein [Pantoea sp. PSNIH2]MDU3816950.1 YgdI/YgdR family lipoprotein [Pantoea sp.]POU52096.1 YgdI/YgdR family lipoprotein [Pantoea sp. PSNIH5]POU69595.1 YgdI/YgdR family lipoprotein [Pantoea sp. PSNIH4]POY69686.1 YgdI/YgdR family lipoprotein [Pantoea sp. PSNIH3]HCW47244.1 YgdI/YgdR family lipoprotein [Erwiniaceae bacterium]
MKRIMGAAAVSIMLLLSGCSSNYVMATKDGHMILTDGKPEIDKDTGLVKYTDQAGNELQINGDEVSSIIER